METPGYLLIDAYNVIHACPELKSDLLGRGEVARQTLIDWAQVIHDVEGLATFVVFDGGGESLEAEHPGEQPNFTIIRAPAGLTADGVIEQLVIKSDSPERCTIISRDNQIRASVRAAGAIVFDANYFKEWAARCSKTRAGLLAKNQKRNTTDWKGSSPWDQLG